MLAGKIENKNNTIKTKPTILSLFVFLSPAPIIQFVIKQIMFSETPLACLDLPKRKKNGN
jgi:hypothetical protein